jgi:hypothetical protein
MHGTVSFFFRRILGLYKQFLFFLSPFLILFALCTMRQTFMRQKVTLSPTVSPCNIVKEESKGSDTNIGPKAQSVSCGSEFAQRGTLCSECNGADSLIISA